MKKAAVILAVMVVAWVGIWLLTVRDAFPPLAASPLPLQNSVNGAEVVQHEVPPSFITGLEQRPASLRGTEVDGVLRADSEGNLVISHDIRRVFDYFMATLGEESLAVIEQRLRAYIRHELPPGAAQQAEQLLEDYLAMNRALSEMQAPAGENDGSMPEVATLRDRLQSIQALRQQYLPADVVEAFYADDDALDQLALGRMEIMQDPTLSAAQRTQALTALDQSLPQHLQAIMNELTKHQQMNALTDSLRRQGGTDAEVYQLRESFFGPDAADRLAQLDQSRQQWRERTSQWLGERDRLIARQDIDPADRERQIEQLRGNFFTPAEWQRVKALEHLRDQGLQ